jgi:hypothetical protein
MSDWYFLLIPLAVFVILLLFGFVGCQNILGLNDIVYGADYPTTVESIPSGAPAIVAYWRLGDPGPTTFKEEIGTIPGIPGTFTTAPFAADGGRHSPQGADTYTFQQAGLLSADSTAKCLETNGGFVTVPFNAGFGNLATFTYMLWVSPEWDTTVATGNYYCLLEMGAPPVNSTTNKTGKKSLGFGLYAGPGTGTPPNNFEFQVWVGDGSNFAVVPNLHPELANVETLDQDGNPNVYFVAVTFDGARVQLIVYRRGGDVNAVTATDQAVTYVANDGSADFLIGAGRNLFPISGSPAPALYPFDGKIEEVSIFNTNLSTGAMASAVVAGGA